jgi:prevent-host-death family protein
MSQKAGVRELRQHLSRFLDRVKAGERFTVTERGRPVALLVPFAAADDPLAELEARGLIVRRATGRIAELGPPPPREAGAPPLGGMLEELREERG